MKIEIRNEIVELSTGGFPTLRGLPARARAAPVTAIRTATSRRTRGTRPREPGTQDMKCNAFSWGVVVDMATYGYSLRDVKSS